MTNAPICASEDGVELRLVAEADRGLVLGADSVEFGQHDLIVSPR